MLYPICFSSTLKQQTQKSEALEDTLY